DTAAKKTERAVPDDDKTELLADSDEPTERVDTAAKKTERAVPDDDKTELLTDSDEPTEGLNTTDDKTERIQPENDVHFDKGTQKKNKAVEPAKSVINEQNIPAIRGELMKQKFSLKALLAIAPVVVLCAAAIIITVVLLNTNPAIRTENYLNSAAKYLIEMNYEQAIIAFDKVLQIDPMNVDAYLGKARAYHALGNVDKAIETLKDGYEKTGDMRIWQLLTEYDSTLLSFPVEPSLETITTSFARIYGVSDGYIAASDEPDGLWYFIDTNGVKLSQTGYTFINKFVGTGDKAYAIAGLSDGRTILINSQLQEVLDLTEKSNPFLFNFEDPLIMCYHFCDYTIKNDYDYIEILKPNGTTIYTWKQDEGVSGNNSDAKTDPCLPKAIKEYKCDNQFHQDLWIDNITVKLEFVDRNLADEVYLYFVFWSEFEYDHTLEDAYIELQRNQNSANSGFTTNGYGEAGHSQGGGYEYLVSYDGSKITLSESGVVVTRTEDYSISYTTRIATAILDVQLNYPNSTKYATLFPRYFVGITNDQISSFYYDLCNKNVVKCCKSKENRDDPDVYALFEPKWYDTKEEANEKNDSEWKQISSDYDYIGTYDGDTDTLLVQKGDKWGFINSGGKEIAMYDDASNFSGGYAVVTENGRGRVIDADFQQIGEDFECEGSYNIGEGIFAVKNGDVYTILVVNS
ncbi:MAG: tetratricopeptide repeat protein, partial [Oscillospiraceae bacterium]